MTYSVVMGKKPVALKENEVVILSAEIEGPRSGSGGKDGLSSRKLKDTAITISDA